MVRGGPRTFRTHRLVPGMVDGWFVCVCGCGAVAVCRHCVPDAPGFVGTGLCDAEERRLQVGKYVVDDGVERRSGVTWG